MGTNRDPQSDMQTVRVLEHSALNGMVPLNPSTQSSLNSEKEVERMQEPEQMGSPGEQDSLN